MNSSPCKKSLQFFLFDWRFSSVEFYTEIQTWRYAKRKNWDDKVRDTDVREVWVAFAMSNNFLLSPSNNRMIIGTILSTSLRSQSSLFLSYCMSGTDISLWCNQIIPTNSLDNWYALFRFIVSLSFLGKRWGLFIAIWSYDTTIDLLSSKTFRALITKSQYFLYSLQWITTTTYNNKETIIMSREIER
jgi:hypothetical protein